VIDRIFSKIMQNSNIINLIISSSPFSQIDGKESVDLALVCAAFEQKVNLIFVDQGIFHLINNQDNSEFYDKNHDSQIKALEFYEIDQVYAEHESIQAFALTEGNLIESSQVINRKEINQMVASAQHTVTF